MAAGQKFGERGRFIVGYGICVRVCGYLKALKVRTEVWICYVMYFVVDSVRKKRALYKGRRVDGESCEIIWSIIYSLSIKRS